MAKRLFQPVPKNVLEWCDPLFGPWEIGCPPVRFSHQLAAHQVKLGEKIYMSAGRGMLWKWSGTPGVSVVQDERARRLLFK